MNFLIVLVNLFIIFNTFQTIDSEYIYVDESEIPELRYMNRSVDPCEDFYEFTCGNFKNVRPKPDDEHIWDHFTILQQEIHRTLRAVLESKRNPAEPTAVQRAKAFYTACVNTQYQDALDLPEARVVAEMGGLPLVGTDFDEKIMTWEHIGDAIARYGLSMFFDIQVGPNLFTGKENAIWLFQDRMPNPTTIVGHLDKNLEKFLDFPVLEKSNASRANAPIPFEAFARKILVRVRNALGTSKQDEEIFADFSEVFAFIRKLMEGGIIDDVLPLSPTPTIAQLQEWTDKQFSGHFKMNWMSFLGRVFALSGVTLTEDMRIMMTNVKQIYGIMNLLRQTDAKVLQNFMLVRLFTYMAPDSEATMREAFDTYYHDQAYDVFPRGEYCLRKTLGYPGNVDFSMALTFSYQRFHFNINKLEAAAEMIEDLHEAFKDILNESDWIDDETREKATKKSDSMITLLGYPEYAEDLEELDRFYGNIRICNWDHFGNSQRLRAFRQALKFQQIGGPRDRALWQNSPLEVNAFYNRPNNRIVFPVSILDPVFFNGRISALDYGRIGAIIGHEITHGFDKSGKNYDESGGMGNLWSSATNASFYEKIECFEEQYGKFFIPEINQFVNGTQTLDENLADNGGLREAFKAFRKLEERRSSMITVKDFTPEQLFFVGYGTMWCMEESDYYLQTMRDSGLYPPGRFRVRGSVSNNVYFSEVFDCPKGSPMNPEDKCVLW